MMNLTERYIVVCVTLLTVCGFVLQAQAQKDFVKTVVDFIEDRNAIEWKDSSNRNILADATEQNGSVVEMRKVLTHDNHVGEIEVDVLHMRVRPSEAVEQFGIMGRKVFTVPDENFIQFQGGVKITSSGADKVSVNVVIETHSGNSWIPSKAYEPRLNKDDEEMEQSRTFLLNLSEWRGQVIRLSLTAEADADVIRVGNETQLNPSEIAAEWHLAKLISSPIGFTLGKPERVNTTNTFSSKTILPTQLIAPSMIGATTDPGSFELVLEGDDTGGGSQVGGLHGPSDTPINTVYIPGNDSLDARWTCYFSSVVEGDPNHGSSSPDEDISTKTRVVDFSGNPTKNMYSGSYTEIRNAVLVDGSNKAIAVHTPSGDACRDFDDHYAAISGVAAATLDNGTNVIHAFIHAEDHFQFEENGGNCEGVSGEHNSGPGMYASIGYARSVDDNTSDFGRVFTNVKSSATSNAIITYATAEDDLPTIDYSSGTGQPSVIDGSDGYYYLFYTSWAELQFDDGNVSVIAVARAATSDVNRTAFSSYANPWKKFKEVNSTWNNSSNWTQPGLGGVESAIWNGKDVGGYRSQYPDEASAWRLAPKVSYNGYLDKLVLVCFGRFASGSTLAMWIYFADDPVNWSNPIALAEESAGSASQFPTIIGDLGHDVYTTEESKLYFRSPTTVEAGIGDLWRVDLTFYN